MSIDPLAEDYVYNSTYAFQENKMGMGRELEGLELLPHAWITADAAVNPNGIGAHINGFAEGLGDSVKGLWNAVTNPVQTAKGAGNTALAGLASMGSPGTGYSNAVAIDLTLGTNSTGAMQGMSDALSNGVNSLISGDGQARGNVLGQITGAVVGAKGMNAATKGLTKGGAKTSVTTDFTVTKQGVAIPQAGGKYSIPSNLIENPFDPPNTASFGTMKGGRFSESLRIDPATPAGRKGPNYSHYHRDNKGKHYSPNGKDKDPGFN